MNKVVLFGASGNLGREIAKELIRQGYDLTAVVRNQSKAVALSKITSHVILADPYNKDSLEHIMSNQEIVVSALGKSVSPFDKSKESFMTVDLGANLNILHEAIRSGIQKFVYVSAFHAEKYKHLNYFRAHEEFSDALKASGMDYVIIKPPALFSAFVEMIGMAKKGQLMSMGKGEKKTNPIFEGDLAKLIVDSIQQSNGIIEAGGKTIYTRQQLLEIIQKQVDDKKRIRTVPLGIIKGMLPVIKAFSQNTFDKIAFFLEVMQHDTIAPPVGTMTFEDYIQQAAKKILPLH